MSLTGSRFVGTGYRAHDPRWAFRPLSGEGAAIRGARFNPRGVPALYLALDLVTAVGEANQGFAHKIEPCLICTYDIDCTDIVDLRSPESHGVDPDDMACPWFLLLSEGKEPPSWRVARRLIAEGAAGALVPSYAPGATTASCNLVLWHWGEHLPHRVAVFDPSGRIPRDQLSWAT